MSLIWLPGNQRVGTVGTDQPAAGAALCDTVVSRVDEVTPSRAALLRQAMYDTLTGVLHRDEVVRRLASSVAAGEKVGERYVLDLDLDGFRPINETFGYAAGDDLLCQVAARLRAVLTDDDLIGRSAADAFVVVTVRADANGAAGCAERILEALRQVFEVAGQQLYLTASLGIAAVDPDAEVHDALRAADVARHRAKLAGRDRYRWYDAEVADEIAQRLHLAGELREALDRSQFTLHYQPAYELRTGRFVSAEALIRWTHPERGLVPPGGFIPTAEATGLIGPIGDWVLAEAARTAVTPAWAGSSVHGRPPRMWVNVSVLQAAVPGFATRVLDRFAAVGLEASRIGLEVTESAMAGHLDTVITELAHLRQVGVQIALDDFGTGYSSLSRLRSLPVDVIKIDRSFVSGLHTRAGRATVATIISLAHAIDATAIAEGVESREELLELERAGCDLVSGFFLARPVPAAELAEIAEEGAAVIAGTRAANRRGGPGMAAWLRRSRRNRPQTVTTPEPEATAENVDALTGLGNHRAACAVIDRHLAAEHRPVLLLVDLDGFRAFDLMRGRDTADALLRAQAARLQAIEGATAFRIDEDVFAVVLPDGRRGPVSVQVDLAALAQGPKGTTTCVGVAHGHAGSTSSDLEHAARLALQRAKRRGHGSVIEGSEHATETPAATSAQARALYAVLREGYLRVHYQPIISLSDDTVFGYEALVRPQLDHGLTGPQEAFQVAEQLGLVPELDAVCRASIFLDGPGFDMAAGTRLFVNIAPEALGHRSLNRLELCRQIAHAGLDPARVVFELRESPGIATELFDLEARRLQERGFAIALDDAGGRCGALRAMREVAFDFAKLSPELLAEAREVASAAATVDALCTFAQRSEIRVIATGVETPKLLVAARSLGGQGVGGPMIHAAQGYHLGRPQPQAKP